MKSINHPWAISTKYRNRYGEVWANLDFVFHDKISEDLFRTDPMNTSIGHLHIYGQQIRMTYKDLINYSKSIKTTTAEVYATGTKSVVTDIRVKSYTFSLARHELSKLSETLSDATDATVRAYELGLYL